MGRLEAIYDFGKLMFEQQLLMMENLENQVPPEARKNEGKNSKMGTEDKPATGAPLRPSPPNSEKRIAKQLGKYQFSIEQKLGSGMSGDVYVGIDTETHQLVCIKAIDRSVYKTAEQKLLLQNQIRCQSICNSDYTIKLLDVFDTTSFCFIVSQFCQGGDLYRLLKTSSNGLPQQLVSFFGLQIANALMTLKQKGIVHRDIKSENILLQKGQVKLGDFGFAIQADKLGKSKFNLGSPLYMSLQALERSQYSYASDIFALGVVLYEMIHKQSPWECSQQSQLINRMKSEQPVVKSGISESMKGLIMSCLSRQCKMRPSIQQVLQHQAFKEYAVPPSPPLCQL